MAQSQLTTEDLAQPTTTDRPDTGYQDDVQVVHVDEAEHAAHVNGSARGDDVPLLDDSVADDFLGRWSEVQTRFVDDPRGAVRDGDSLVAELMQVLAQRFSQYKSDLEDRWQQGDEPETEDLRLALQQYRSFFQRLLST